MKIAQVTPVYPPRIGGIGNVAQEYAQGLVRDNFDVTVFTPLYQLDEAGTDEQIVDRTAPLYKWGNAALVPQLIWKLRKFDLIHLHYPFYGGAESSALAALIWRKPLVVTYHMKPIATGWQEGIFRIYRLLIEPIIFSIAKKICVSSLDYARSVGLESKKLIELPFSVDIDRFIPGDAQDIRSELGIDHHAKVIIFVGGLDDAHYFKGVDVLIESCSRLTTDVDWHLIIVGDGNKKKQYQELALEKNIIARIHFVGRVSHEDLPKYYQASDFHILPAINRCEAFGLVTLEAASSGLVSIVSNLPGVRTLVSPGETGFIIDPSNVVDLSNAITKLLEDDNLRYKFGQSARKRAENHFAKVAIYKKLKEIYQSVRISK